MPELNTNNHSVIPCNISRKNGLNCRNGKLSAAVRIKALTIFLHWTLSNNIEQMKMWNECSKKKGCHFIFAELVLNSIWDKLRVTLHPRSTIIKQRKIQKIPTKINFYTNSNELFKALENKLYCFKYCRDWNNCGIATCQQHRHLNPATCPHMTDVPAAERLTVTQQGLCLSSAEVLITDFACTHTLSLLRTHSSSWPDKARHAIQ